MATIVPNSVFTGSLAKFGFQVHNLHLLKVPVQVLGNNTTAGIVSSRTLSEYRCVCADPSNAAFPLGAADYFLGIQSLC